MNITEQADEETLAENITGGWILEIDNYDDEAQVAFNEGNGEWIRFTYHSPEVLSDAQKDYLTTFLKAADNAIYANNKQSTNWEYYIDIDALARFYIVQEVMDNAESFHGSCYMHKDRGENTKLVFGPVWDFGNSYHRGYNKFIYQDSPFGMNWIGEIAKFPRFQTQVKNIWQPFLGDNYPSIDSYIDQFIDQIADAAKCDAARWPRYGTTDIDGKKRSFKNAMQQKVEFLRQQWGDAITGISEITAAGSTGDVWYTLGGQRLDRKPTQKGIYIRNSKKVIVD